MAWPPASAAGLESPAVASAGSAVAAVACWVVGSLGRLAVPGRVAASGWEAVVGASPCGGSLPEGAARGPCVVMSVAASMGLPRRM